MSINTIGNNPAQTATERNSSAQSAAPANQGKAEATGTTPSSATSGDTVHISSKAVDLQALEARINELPEVDRARVTELRNQIANGQFEINSSRVAEKILGFDAALK
ncbi:MAG: flagellar biosynthesis anti-sigma factor FlgM [Pseudomonadales bacterium]|nr:flagellar biosynthesis anti-sigma factor FlgM [Pseudomonadales bacterium]